MPLKHDPEGRQRRNKLLHCYSGIVGESPALVRMLRELDLVVGEDGSVLLLGESGTGKELAAHAIAVEGKRASQPFEAHNAAAISSELFESTMFGYEKDSFNNAQKTTPGVFERCHGGTLFLDEIADIVTKHQPKTLRAVEYGKLFRVGGKAEITVDVRVIGATSRDIDAYVREGKFREDLFFRMDDERICVPSLRERKSDIPLLLRHHLKERAAIFGAEALAALAAYDWPGNVRELFQVAQRVARRVKRRGGAFATSEEVRAQLRGNQATIGANVNPAESGRAFKSLPREKKKLELLRVLEQEKYDLRAVMRRLGYRRFSLLRLMGSLEIPRRPVPCG